ncbi:hypothetical protein [Thermosulfurimonas sp. F29]|uniref:hypothetical protein n=1 Tax=Thermosulfurimonas sp. F29 TaxID=2867247 RepID=UPI001C82D04C|nr:hypothetical protein [Thermosulfurimonas sp. F29]MBX6423046.1 hypothetical protein [Thermosulfurimonas sp. F29]
METVLVDTSFLVALLCRRDVHQFSFRETVDVLRRMVPNPAQFAYYLAWKFWDVWDLAIESQGRLTFNDALLVIGCREEGVRRIASFDRGFEGYLEVLK